MTRSYWHTPIKAFAGQNSSKQWRSAQNRRYRSYCKNLMRHNNYELPDYCNMFGNEWDSPRDGKGWVGDYKYYKCPYICNNGFVYCTKDSHHCYKYYNEMMRK